MQKKNIKNIEAKNKAISESFKATKLKRQNQLCKVFDVKIQYNKLSKRQKHELKMLFVEAKWLWNDCLNYCNQDPTNTPFNYSLTDKVQVKNKDGNFEERELKYIGSQQKQSVIKQLQSNIKTLATLKKKGLQNPGKIKFKSDFKQLELKQYGISYKFYENSKMNIQNVFRKVKVSGLEQFLNKDYDFANAKLIKYCDKDFHIKITCYIDKDKIKEVKTNKSIGIDFGCETSFTLSNGQKFNSYIEETEKLKLLQRKLETKIKHSNNRRKLISKIRKEYLKINNRKNDAANKFIHYLLSNFDYIAIQNEQIADWHENNHGDKVQHSILGRVKNKLLQSSKVNMVSKWFASSKTCSKCGHKIDELKLSQRIYICPNCGFKEDRDINAAINILKESTSGTEGFKSLIQTRKIPT